MHYALVLLALGALLALHELGHLVAARLLGVKVPRFVFGFGPPLLSFRLWGTQYVFAAVPLGATAHVQGMNPHRSDAEEPASFRVLGPLRRVLIVLAGPLANALLALGILFALYTSGTHVVVPLTVGTVLPGSEAARAQLLPGDRIVSVAGQPLKNWSEFVEKVAESPGRPLELAVDRHGELRTVQVRPRPDERGAGRIGVSQQYVYRTHEYREALGHSLTHIGNVASEGLSMLVRLVKGQGSADAAGPGALMRQESSDAAASGWDSMLRALVAASVALAMLTMLPVPGLDGGRVLLLLVEAASGRKLPARVETVAQTVGFFGIAAAIVAMAGAEIRRALPEPAQPPPPVANNAPAVAAPPTVTGGSAQAPVAAGSGAPTARPVASDAGAVVSRAAAPDASTPAQGVATGLPTPATSADAGAAAPVAGNGAPSPTVASDGGTSPAPATPAIAVGNGAASGGVTPDAGAAPGAQATAAGNGAASSGATPPAGVAPGTQAAAPAPTGTTGTTQATAQGTTSPAASPGSTPPASPGGTVRVEAAQRPATTSTPAGPTPSQGSAPAPPATVTDTPR
ncbi:site-2 protease family protein [Pyxidicoccus parkwayensis]|uniref:Site-2 protease family protein n=1 Tax=Pyxidicoccus parkwayensis TaxID=2813578 RepID=A0ABX7PBT3_9BACT|nr:M50 family metallopeptidase [Pyxidicoccus parkwaysis]QSQ27891.1 site-2 protease family protein [Pyxidicoccus parkwaysis]